MFECTDLKFQFSEMKLSCKRGESQLSKNLLYEKLYIVYRIIYDTQVQRTNLKAIEMDKVTGTRKAGDMENTPIL